MNLFFLYKDYANQVTLTRPPTLTNFVIYLKQQIKYNNDNNIWMINEKLPPGLTLINGKQERQL